MNVVFWEISNKNINSKIFESMYENNIKVKENLINLIPISINQAKNKHDVTMICIESV